MRNTAKKLFSLVAAATLVTSTLAMTACNEEFYKPANTVEYTPSATTNGIDNGGFSVEKDGYIYYINGKESYTAENVYGDVVKGALMRIKKEDLTAGRYDQSSVVIPMLFVAQNYKAGIFIYGDYVYYATPTADKNMDGEVANTHLDFKRARLDGTQTMKDHYFRLSSNSANYRFVEAGEGEAKAVYCLYEEDGALKSFNTSKPEQPAVVLAKGGTYVFDKEDLSNPNVYYTMKVPYNVDTDAPSNNVSYNQVYCVNAAATAEVNAGEASYTVKGGKKYDFDKDWMEAQNDKAKKAAKENGTEYTATYDFNDYSTYPYVNLGSLVLDGVGKNYADYEDTRFNGTVEEADCKEWTGYTYTLSAYNNDGIYFTKASDTKLYYLSEAHGESNAIKANAKAEVVTSELSTEEQGTALFMVSEENNVRTHTYLYVSDGKIKKASRTGDVEKDAIAICKAPENVTLWKTVQNDEDSELYYYAAGTNPVTNAASSGMQLSRIVYNGADEVYQNLPSLVAEEKYKPVTISYVDFAGADTWYLPEMYGDVLLYANAAAINGTSYNYVYATKIDLDTVTANNAKYEAAYKAMNETEKDTVKKAMTYYYRTGDAELIEGLKKAELYKATEYELFTEYVAASQAEGGFGKETDLISLVGKFDDVVSDADKDAMNEGWRATLPAEKETTEEESGLETWAICLIVAAGVVVLAVAIIVPVMIVSKKRAEKAAAEATVNAYKRKKIDTTDDKSIDVYADDEDVKVETVEEVAEETQE